MGLVIGSVGKGTCHAILETWIPLQDPNSGKKQLILASSDLCNHTSLIIRCDRNFKINRNEGLVHPDIYEAWKHCKGKGSILANRPSRSTCNRKSGGSKRNDEEQQLNGMDFIWGNENVELDKNWPYTVRVLTTNCDVANVIHARWRLSAKRKWTIDSCNFLNEIFKVKESDSKSNNHLDRCPEWILQG